MERDRLRSSALIWIIIFLSLQHLLWSSMEDFLDDIGHSQTLPRRTSSRKIVPLILAAILVIIIVLATGVEGVLDNHGNTYRPPPGLHPWTSMAGEFHSFKQQHSFEQDGFAPLTRDSLDHFTEHWIRTMTEIEEGAKFFKQRLIEMRRYAIRSQQHADNHPRLEAAGTSGKSCATNEERQDHNRNKLKLCFQGSLKSRIYTNTPLLAQSNRGIEIVICNDAQIITSGPLASLRVEIVALESNHSCKGAWTEEDFDCQIRKSRDGQGSVLDGECLVELVSGRASLGNIHFKERSTWARSREFVLAARVCRSDNVGGPRVEEAFMHPPVMVLVERSKANEKTSHPKLNDRVHDWKGTARHGAYDKRLEKENIHTVQDFLKALNKDSDKLCQILEIKSKKRSSWEAVVRHARECDLGDNHELKSYKVEMENVKLFFNCIDDLVGAEFHDCFIAKDKFGERQKVLVEAHLKQAYMKLDEIEFDYVMEGNYPVKIYTDTDAPGNPSISKLLGASPQNTPAHQATFQAVENLSLCGCGADRAPDNSLGDANRNAAEQSAPAPSPQVFVLGLPPDTASADVYMENLWKLVEEPQNNVLDCSCGGAAATTGIPSFSPNAHGSEGTNDELGFRFDELGITPSDVLDESIHGFYGGEFQQH